MSSLKNLKRKSQKKSLENIKESNLKKKKTLRKPYLRKPYYYLKIDTKNKLKLPSLKKYKDEFEIKLTRLIKELFPTQEYTIEITLTKDLRLCCMVKGQNYEQQNEKYENAEIDQYIPEYTLYDTYQGRLSDQKRKQYKEDQLKLFKMYTEIDQIILCVGFPQVDYTGEKIYPIDGFPDNFIEIPHILTSGIFRGRGLGLKFLELISDPNFFFCRDLNIDTIIFKDYFDNRKKAGQNKTHGEHNFDYHYSKGTQKWLLKNGFSRQFRCIHSWGKVIRDNINQIFGITALFLGGSQYNFTGEYLSSPVSNFQK